MRDFIPAARVRFFTRAYDALCRAIGLGDRFRAFQLSVLGTRPAEDTLEVGCGTGELLVRLARAWPAARIVGVDIDPEALALAAGKVGGASMDTRLVIGSAAALPFSSASFDLVVASLMVHHLRTDQKRAAFREWRRVLRAGGRVLVFDFSAPASRFARALTWPLRHNLLEETGDHFAGRVPSIIAEAGFSVHEAGSYGVIIRAWSATPWGACPKRLQRDLGGAQARRC